MSTRFHARETIEVDAPPEEVFTFLCEPQHEVDVTPLEDAVTDGEAAATSFCREGDVRTFTLDIAAREVIYRARCREIKAPRTLCMDLEGELEGTQEWHLEPTDGGTRVTLDMAMKMPSFMHPYLQEPEAAEHWGQMLVNGTLDNLRLALDDEDVGDQK